MSGVPQPSAKRLSEKTAEQAKAFISSLFMSVRTAQIHDAANQAFSKAIQSTHAAARSLFAVTNGFVVQFVEHSVLVNQAPVRFEGGTFNVIRSLTQLLEANDIGGVSIDDPPTYESIERLVLSLSVGDRAQLEDSNLGIRVLGLQAFEDDTEAKADRRILAVQAYAKLILALREQNARHNKRRSGDELRAPRLRVVRILQDLVELCNDRPDYLLRLSTNQGGLPIQEMHGVNVCLIALAMARLLGCPRRDLVDIGMGALFHHIAWVEGEPLRAEDVRASTAYMASLWGAQESSLLRTSIIGHQRKWANASVEFREGPPHLYARLIGVAVTYHQLVSGFGTKGGHRHSPPDALRVMSEDRTGRLDLDLVDLLINTLRVFPVGCGVVLDNGEAGIVRSQVGATRWDRPVIAMEGNTVDLMIKDGSRFARRIIGTTRLMGFETPVDTSTQVGSTDVLPPPDPEDATSDLLVRHARQVDVPTTDDLEDAPPPEEVEALLQNFLQGSGPKPELQGRPRRTTVDTSYSSSPTAEDDD